jgi:hypothetical protein
MRRFLIRPLTWEGEGGEEKEEEKEDENGWREDVRGKRRNKVFLGGYVRCMFDSGDDAWVYKNEL